MDRAPFLYDAADEIARAEIKDRLYRGKTVNGLSLADAFSVGESEIRKEREIVEILVSLVTAEFLDLPTVQMRARKLVDDWIDTLSEEIEEEAAEIREEG